MTAQWDDDIHHAIHTAVSGERQGYYARFRHDGDAGARRCSNGYFHAGHVLVVPASPARPAAGHAPIPATRLLAYTCTHDQVGNRAVGDRPSQNLDHGQLADQGRAGTRVALYGNAFHGRGVGFVAPVPVLQLPSRAGAGRGDRGGPQSGVRRPRLGRRRRPRPAGPRDLPAVQAGLGRDQRAEPRGAAGVLPGADRVAPQRTRPGRPVAGPTWSSTTTRTSAGSSCAAVASRSRATSGEQRVRVPVTGEVLLGWGEPDLDAEGAEPAGPFRGDRQGRLSRDAAVDGGIRRGAQPPSMRRYDRLVAHSANRDRDRSDPLTCRHARTLAGAHGTTGIW